jgi:predicted pyridoxine 5'-phosphate oxidase superfamily flavin-nucleotide-binding protein
MTAHGHVFHEGELTVQQAAGVGPMAAKLGPRVIQWRLDRRFADFLREQQLVIVASGDRSRRTWASALMGPPGFSRARSSNLVVVRAEIPDDDPLATVLEQGEAAVGLLVLEPISRARIRINGVGRRTPGGLEIAVSEVFGNCPKYIQRRVPRAAAPADSAGSVFVGQRLDKDQTALVETADTFFIASRHPARGADASHRGGRPGFVQVSEQGAIATFPDYPGNNMFQTLGNIAAEPAVGLLFIDWESARTLQITGQAEVIWDRERAKRWPGAERLVDVRIDSTIDRAHGLPVTWEFVEAHRLNPPAPLGTADPRVA